MAPTEPDLALLVCLGPSAEPLAAARTVNKWWPESCYVFCPLILSILKSPNTAQEVMRPPLFFLTLICIKQSLTGYLLMNKLLLRPPLSDQAPIYSLMAQVQLRATQGGELLFRFRIACVEAE